MPVFDYRAQDCNGRPCRGTEEAESPRQARQALRARGLLPIDVRPAKGQEQRARGVTSRVRLASSELALLTLQLSTLIQAGLPLEEALRAVAAQSEKPRVSHLLSAVRARVLEGNALASALDGFPRAFPEVFRATIAAGERSGHLGYVLEQLALYTEARQQSRQQIQMALVYPLIVLFASFSIVAFLLGYVVPDIVKIFVNSGQPLPLLTQGMIAISGLLRSYGVLLFGLLVGLVFMARWALRQRGVRLRWHAMLLRLPLVGKVLRAIEAARFASTLAILGKSAVPLVDGLEIAAAVVGNLVIRGRIGEVARAVREGGTLSRALELSGDIPPMMLHMIASGERAGELDRMLSRAAQQQEKTLASRISLVVSLFEPAILVLMGGVVLLIVMAILLPILSLNQLVT